MTADYPPKLLLTGDPGCGKTTTLRRIVERLQGRVAMSGFYTEEERENGKRVGFRGMTLSGESFPLARRGAESPLRVGDYGVVLAGLESIGLAALRSEAACRLFVLDEIGKMELFSADFRATVERLLADPRRGLLATIAPHGVGLVRRLRNDPRVTLLRLRRDNRDGMVEEIVRRLGRAGLSSE